MRKVLVAGSLLSCVALTGCRDKAPAPIAAAATTVDQVPVIAAKISAARTATAASRTITISAVSETNTNGVVGRTTQTASIDRVSKSQAIHVTAAAPDELGLVAPEYDFITVDGQAFLGPLRKRGTYVAGDPNELGAGRRLISIKAMFNTIDEATWAPGLARTGADGKPLECFYAFLKDGAELPNLNPAHAKAILAAAQLSTTAPLDRSTAEVCIGPAGKLAHLGFEVKSVAGSELIGVDVATDAPVTVTKPVKLDPNPERILKKIRGAGG